MFLKNIVYFLKFVTYLLLSKPYEISHSPMLQFAVSFRAK